MALIASVGQAKVTNTHEAGMQAVHQALNLLRNATPRLCLLIIPHKYEPSRVIDGVTSVLTNIPILGFSVSAGLSQTGITQHSIMAVLFGGDDLHAETHLFNATSQTDAKMANLIAQLTAFEQRPAKHVLVFAGGQQGNIEAFCKNLPLGFPLSGGLSSGDPAGLNTFEMAGTQWTANGLSAAILRGSFNIGTAWGQAWECTGSRFTITQSDGYLIKQIDGKPVPEKYMELFGHTQNEWISPPLNTLCRIYPLGVEQQTENGLRIISPICIEKDGNLRMNISLPQGSTAYIMVGSPENCQNSIRTATLQALKQLGNSKPIFALVLVDTAWQSLLQTQPGMEIHTVQEVLGKDIPVAGGYTLGQILPPEQPESQPCFANQHFFISLFASGNTQE